MESRHWQEKPASAELPQPKCVPPHGVRNEPDSDPVEFARNRLGFDPDEKQSEVLRSTSKRGILNCTRQWGKTSVLAAKVIHRLFTEPGSTALVASPGLRQTHEFFQRLESMLRHLGIPIRRDRENTHSLVFPNGSRVVGLPQMPDKSRGFASVSMLIFDEAAYISDEMYQALLPMLAVSNGDIWVLSTPNGKSGFFYDTWQHGGDPWHRFMVKATDCPRISPDFIEEMRSSRGDDYVRQEFMCEFLGSGNHAFDRELVESAFDSYVEALTESLMATRNDAVPNWLSGRPESSFYVGIDLGRKRDHAAIVIVERTDLMLLRYVRRIPLGTPYQKVVDISREIVRSPRLAGRCSAIVDGSGVGDPVMEMFRNAQLGCHLLAVNITGGRNARHTNVPKFDLMSGLHLALEKGELRIAKMLPEAQSLAREFLSIRINENGSMGAEGSDHDDLVMAVALACWAAKRKKNDWGSGGALL